MNKTTSFATLLSISCALGGAFACDVDQQSELGFRASQDFSYSIAAPDESTPVDHYVKAGNVLHFAGEYFFLALDGAQQQPLDESIVKGVAPGDVLGLVRNGNITKFTAIGLDTHGAMLILPEKDAPPSFSPSLIDTLIDRYAPDPDAVLECVNDAIFAGQQCVAEGGATACCIGYQAQAMLMCGVNPWGSNIPDNQGAIWAQLCEEDAEGGPDDPGEGGSSCDSEWTHVEDVPVEVNGQECRYTGWAYSQLDPDTGECVTILDLATGVVECDVGDPGGELPPPGENQPL